MKRPRERARLEGGAVFSGKSVLERHPRKASGKRENLKEEASGYQEVEVTRPNPTRKTTLGFESRAGPKRFPAPLSSIA